MKKLIRFALFATTGFLSTAAFSQVPVNIVYPINGGSYPVTGSTGAGSAYITASFGTTCPGGPHNVEWGFNGLSLGDGNFYDQMSVQLTHKLPTGTHRFWVRSDCGTDRVKFVVH